MSGSGAARSATAAALRQEFDRSFSRPPEIKVEGHQGFLAIRAAGDPLALRLADLAGLYVDRKIVPVPSSARTLLGVAAFRGVMTPIHDLRAILGYPAVEKARWVFLARAAAAIGFAFELFEGYFAAPIDADISSADDGRRAGHAGGAVRGFDAVRPVVNVASVLAAIGLRGADHTLRKDR